jgi:hypothetical protein
MTTGGSGTIIEGHYVGCPVRYRVVVEATDDTEWGLGMGEPTLVEPIDYDAELKTRQETYEPMSDVDGELGNSLFGV